MGPMGVCVCVIAFVRMGMHVCVCVHVSGCESQLFVC